MKDGTTSASSNAFEFAVHTCSRLDSLFVLHVTEKSGAPSEKSKHGQVQMGVELHKLTDIGKCARAELMCETAVAGSSVRDTIENFVHAHNIDLVRATPCDWSR